MTLSDSELLRQYCAQKSEGAFAALVSRHLDLVYSAALRQVRSRQLAEEVAQSVFTDLSRSAGTLKPDTILAAWLYQVTRRTAVDVVRKESRRQLREKIAMEIADMNSTSSDWAQVGPLLDEAMDSLDETDRGAILLRYFKNKSLREVGELLGVSEDAAQKRMSRALERLRAFFSRRGVAVGATGLAALVSANAVQAAPIGLAVTISTAAAIQTTAVAVTKAVAMTTIQKTLIATIITAAVGTGIYETQRASHFPKAVQSQPQQQREHDPTPTPNARPWSDELSNKPPALQSENEQLRGQIDAPKASPQELDKIGRELTHKLNGKLDSIIVPKIEFHETVLGEALDWLRETSRELDAAGLPASERGVNIVFKHGKTDPDTARVTMARSNLSLRDALSAVAGIYNLKIEVQPYAVVLRDP